MTRPDWVQEWIDALRSGEYTQGKVVLHDPHENTYCCLGVLADLQDAWVDPDHRAVTYPGDGLPNANIYYGSDGALEVADGGFTRAYRLASQNDSGRSFEEIATEIERMYPVWPTTHVSPPTG